MRPCRFGGVAVFAVRQADARETGRPQEGPDRTNSAGAGWRQRPWPLANPNGARDQDHGPCACSADPTPRLSRLGHLNMQGESGSGGQIDQSVE